MRHTVFCFITRSSCQGCWEPGVDGAERVRDQPPEQGQLPQRWPLQDLPGGKPWTTNLGEKKQVMSGKQLSERKSQGIADGFKIVVIHLNFGFFSFKMLRNKSQLSEIQRRADEKNEIHVTHQ